MRRADIEVPNHPVDMDAWEWAAWYARGTFYSLSNAASVHRHRITSPDFRPCSDCRPRSHARLCDYTRNPIANRAERTFVRVRYSLGGNRPSLTTR